MTTTKKTTTKKSAAKKTTPKDTGAMDEFINTMVGVTLKEEDIVEKKPKVKAKKINTVIEGTSKIDIETIPETETSAQPAVDENDTEKQSEAVDFTTLLQEEINQKIEDTDWGDEDVVGLKETKINRITTVSDESGNVLYYKVPADCEELQGIINKKEFVKSIAKLISDDIYKKLNQEDTVKQEPVEVKPVDITPEVVAPKPVFPLRVVDKW